MGYVALSRVRSLSGIKLLDFNEMALEVNPEIFELDKKLFQISSSVSREFEKLANISESKDFSKTCSLSADLKSKAYDVQEIRKRHPKAYAPWTDEEDRKLLEKCKIRMSPKELVKIFGRQPGAIRLRLEKLNNRQKKSSTINHFTGGR